MKTRFHTIDTGQPCYLIAELSHNHQADGSIALLLVEAAAASGANAVKFQKRNNATLYSAAYLESAYGGPNSFGNTYGEHREALEPKPGWLRSCGEAARQLGLDFIMTVFDLESLAFCERELVVDAYKIQSGDLCYPDLIKAVAATGKPYFMSCGAATYSEIKAAWTLCCSLGSPFLIMYAVSAYPTLANQVNLRRFGQLRKQLGTDQLGFSCHYPGIAPSILARAMGSLAIEKHFTLDRHQPGPDHAISLLPLELKELRIRLAETDSFMGTPFAKGEVQEPEAHQRSARYKMGKSAVAARNLKTGELLQATDVQYVSPAAGINPMRFERYLLQPLATNINRGDYFELRHFIPEDV